eukprot:scaffold106310_cov16-Tisochrysis_lutea.AAC.3
MTLDKLPCKAPFDRLGRRLALALRWLRQSAQAGNAAGRRRMKMRKWHGLKDERAVGVLCGNGP